MKPPPEIPHPAIQEINTRHIRSIDKFYRMYAGAASELLSFKDGMLELELRLDPRSSRSPGEMALKIARSWRREPELSEAPEYRVHVYRTERLLGFVTDAGGRSKQAILEEMKALRSQLARAHPDILLGTVEGRFERGDD